MIATIIVGNTGRGKSTASRKLLTAALKEEMEVLVYDPNNDYSDVYKKPFESKKEFLEKASKKTHSFILFEEATMFFSNKGSEEKLLDLLVRKRHTGNKIVLVFHSLRSVPTYILELCNYMVLYKTADRPSYTLAKFEGFDEITEAYNELNEIPDDTKQNFHANFVIELNKPVHLL